MKLVDAINEAGKMLSGHAPALAAKTHITLVVEVSAELRPECDFNINGKILDSLPVAEFNKKYANRNLNDWGDFDKSHVKVMWSDSVIEATDENCPFLPDLVARFVRSCPESNVVEVMALRNKYASSLVCLTLPH